MLGTGMPYAGGHTDTHVGYGYVVESTVTDKTHKRCSMSRDPRRLLKRPHDQKERKERKKKERKKQLTKQTNKGEKQKLNKLYASYVS